MSSSKSFPLPVNGIDVLSEETSLQKGTAREAVNVDIDRTGGFARRDGFVAAEESGRLHSLYYAAQKGWTLIGEDNRLYRLNTETFTRTLLYTFGSPEPFSYMEYNGNIYCSNRSGMCWVPSDSVDARRVGLPPPDAPILSQAVGGLDPGHYGVCITMLDSRGEESGASTVGTLEVTTGALRLHGLPQSLNHTVVVYMTSTNGDVLREVTRFPAVFPLMDVSELAQGAQCDTQHLKPMAPGEFVRWLNGRIYTARDGVLYFSQPMRPHLYNPAHGLIPFSGHIAFIEAVADGLFVGDSRGVWFVDGADPSKASTRLVSQNRAIRRSSITVPSQYFDPEVVQQNSHVAMWLGTTGHTVGMPGGGVAELNSTRVRVDHGVAGRSAFLLRNGRKQVISLVNSLPTAAKGVALNS